jgi:hypothetical protein
VAKKIKRPNRLFYQNGINFIGRIEQEPYFDQNVIKDYADQFREFVKSVNKMYLCFPCRHSVVLYVSLQNFFYHDIIRKRPEYNWHPYATLKTAQSHIAIVKGRRFALGRKERNTLTLLPLGGLILWGNKFIADAVIHN